MNKKKEVLLLIFLIILFFAINYDFLDSKLEEFLIEYEIGVVERIIDGDTVIINGNSTRLLGINTPERGEAYYDEAKQFLSGLILNETVKLEFGKTRYDKYDRNLAYIFLDDRNINIEIVEKGFANHYFYSGRDKYSNYLEEAWNKCIENNKNLCEASANKCAICIKVIDSFLVNLCSFSCDLNGWQIKDEGREKFIFNETLLPNEKIKFELDLENSGGNLFLRDSNGKLVLWSKDQN